METPTITSSTYVTSTVDSANTAWLQQMVGPAHAGGHLGSAIGLNRPTVIQHKELAPMSSARIVKVFIADPNENIPLASRVLHSGEEQLTDLTDQELFFEVPIAEILAKHNDLRKSTVDKKAAEKFGRDIFLEPARIRDLRMVVATC
jgi:hypothetical protein